MNELNGIDTVKPPASQNGHRNGLIKDHKESQEPLRGVAVVGLGYWGPNWVRNFQQGQFARRIVACDLDETRRAHVSQLYSDLETTSRFEDVLSDPDIEGIVVATPVSTHYKMARRALEANKSVLVEKPLATSSQEAEELLNLARERKKVLMVGHTFEYSAPVLKMREIIASGELGDVFYVSSVRANLGLFQRDVNVTWDLATHDISIILNLMGGRMQEAVSCPGESH